LPVVDESQVKKLAKDLDVSEAVAQVYMVRGLNDFLAFEEFCDVSATRIHDPYLLPDMKPAVDRLAEAITNNKLITVIGDGDCDGVCSTALAVYALRALNANVKWHVPNRLNDGFGLSEKSIEIAKGQGSSLVVSVDCGIEALRTAEYARSIGMDLIITDHHEPRQDGFIPDCVACINPKRKNSLYPFPHLAGVGVAFKFMLALCERLGCEMEQVFNELIEFVAIGTCADVVSMTGENRVLVDYGCKELSKTSKAGLKKLKESANVKRVDSESIGYSIAPLINASCRLGEPYVGVLLLLESDDTKAEFHAQYLKELNSERKTLQDDLLHYITDLAPMEDAEKNIQFYAGRDWHRGLIGLVAGNLTSSCGKPSFVCSIEADGTVFGSCRSSCAFNVLEALNYSNDLLSSYGGHKQAAGFKLQIDNLELFEKRLIDYTDQVPGEVSANQMLEIDAEIDFTKISMETYSALANLAPFGHENPQPILYTPGLVVLKATAFSGGKHLNLLLTDARNKKTVSAIGWNMGHLFDHFGRGVVVDVVHSLQLDAYWGKETLRLRIVDIECAK